MPQIIDTISAENVTRIVDAYCGMFRYQEFITNPVDPEGDMIPNPESRNAFAQRIRRKISYYDIVRGWESQQNEKAALAAVPPPPDVPVT